MGVEGVGGIAVGVEALGWGVAVWRFDVAIGVRGAWFPEVAVR